MIIVSKNLEKHEVNEMSLCVSKLLISLQGLGIGSTCWYFHSVGIELLSYNWVKKLRIRILHKSFFLQLNKE